MKVKTLEWFNLLNEKNRHSTFTFRDDEELTILYDRAMQDVDEAFVELKNKGINKLSGLKDKNE